MYSTYGLLRPLHPCVHTTYFMFNPNANAKMYTIKKYCLILSLDHIDHTDSPEFTVISWILQDALFFRLVNVTPLSGTETDKTARYSLNMQEAICANVFIWSFILY